MQEPSLAHDKAMRRLMEYCVSTEQRGLLLKPEGQWDGTADYEFEISGRSDSDYAKQHDRKSVSGISVFLNGAPIQTKSKTQKHHNPERYGSRIGGCCGLCADDVVRSANYSQHGA